MIAQQKILTKKETPHMIYLGDGVVQKPTPKVTQNISAQKLPHLCGKNKKFKNLKVMTLYKGIIFTELGGYHFFSLGYSYIISK